MLIRNYNQLLSKYAIKLVKYADDGNTPIEGAFSSFNDITFSLEIPDLFGVTDVDIFFSKDGEEAAPIRMKKGKDNIFSIRFSLKDYGAGLYYYSFKFIFGNDILWSDSVNNVDILLSDIPASANRLLVYDKSFTVPEWFSGGIMYHIFVDRFRKSGKSPKREDAINEDNWNAPVSQFGAYPGAEVKNNLFYGGDLYGIEEKLPYLKSLGISIIYLSPIFKAYSNHKYDTSDYSVIDSAFGGEEAFESLIKSAKKHGMRIILDGVFNHTGDDSLWFDRYSKYGNGAWNNPDSPYRDYYCFENDGSYKSWWGIKILPKLNLDNPKLRDTIVGPEGIVAKYINDGISGWRLDVADELPDSFLDELRTTAKNTNKDTIIIGEVWENAADKIAYGNRRRYFQGKQLDSVMNYPFRTALLEFLKTGNGNALSDELRTIYSSYPKFVCDALMNIVGTHDTERILTVLGDSKYSKLSNAELSTHKMTNKEKELGIKLLKIASAIQYTVYGVPSLFYGDEAGIEGGRDPFCRKTYPWSNENPELLEHYIKLGKIRKSNVFKDGSFRILSSGYGYISFERYKDNESYITAVNLTGVEIETDYSGTDMLSGKENKGIIPPLGVVIIKK